MQLARFFEPRQIKRIARSRAESAIIAAQSEIEITNLHRRAAHRWIDEEAQRQKNIEDVTAKALPMLNDDSKPDSIEDDWLVNFFDKSRIVSDNEMQELWSRVLASEANAPGTYSRRTVNFLSDLDKAEAELFAKLCGFVWEVVSELVPLVLDYKAEIYESNGISFVGLGHLESIGLIKFNEIAGFTLTNSSGLYAAYYEAGRFRWICLGLIVIIFSLDR